MLFPACCNSGLDKVLDFAGNNKGELERALQHFKEVGGNERYAAAKFLVENMGDSYALAGPSLDSFYVSLTDYYRRANVDVWSLYDFEDSLFQHITFADLKRQYDAQHIKASYIIRRVEDAFSLKERVNWLKNTDFADFCEYVLPYRVGTELLEDWCADYKKEFGPALEPIVEDETSSIYDFCEAVSRMFPEPHRNYTNYPVSKPSSTPSSLKHIVGGTCDDYLGLFTYIGRSYGVPVAMDFTPQWANHSKGHSWCAVIQGDTTYHYSVGEPLFLAKEKPFTFQLSKVYRKMASVQPSSMGERFPSSLVPSNLRNNRIKDVTKEYADVVSFEIKNLYGEGRTKCVYLMCFNDRDWTPVDGGERKGSSVCFKDVAYPAVFLPVFYRDGESVPAQSPVLVDSMGVVKRLVPNKNKLQRVRLNRKFMDVRAWQFVDCLRGGYFELSNDADFKDAETIMIPDTVGFNYQTVPVNPEATYRYVRYCAPIGGSGNIAELEVYSETGEELIGGRVIGNYCYVDAVHPMSNAFDKNTLSYAACSSSQKDAWLGLDFGRPQRLSKICFLARSDDNFIREGDEYELFYWDDEWISLGKQHGSRATQELIYDNVPSGALLLLRDLSRGVEERIFTYENNHQIWW